MVFSKTDVIFFYVWHEQGFTYELDSHYTGHFTNGNYGAGNPGPTLVNYSRRVNQLLANLLDLIRRSCGGFKQHVRVKLTKPRHGWPNQPQKRLELLTGYFRFPT